jgi:hypothetical protein
MFPLRVWWRPPGEAGTNHRLPVGPVPPGAPGEAYRLPVGPVPPGGPAAAYRLPVGPVPPGGPAAAYRLPVGPVPPDGPETAYRPRPSLAARAHPQSPAICPGGPPGTGPVPGGQLGFFGPVKPKTAAVAMAPDSALAIEIDLGAADVG